MEEISETAKNYYNNLTEEQKSKAKEMFLSMDLNGDGSVSVSEYVKVFGEMGFKSCNNESFFVELDKNGDGMLDFDEFLCLYYLHKSDRLVFCDGHGCRAFLKGIYFTCVDCFNNKPNTFDLCSSCFNDKNYDRSQHTTLLDNFTLLRCMARSKKKVKPNSYSRLKEPRRRLGYAPYYDTSKKSSSSSSVADAEGGYNSSEKNKIGEAAEALETAVKIGELAADCCACSIM